MISASLIWQLRVFFDKPIFELIKAWLRNLGIVAFNQIKTKYDGENNPVVGSFEWDITAPSYVSLC